MSSKIGIIIRREFMERVTKKSFIITTLLMPVIMLALMIVPTLIALFSEGDDRTVLVVDDSGIIARNLEAAGPVSFAETDIPLDSALNIDSVDAVLYIPADIADGQKPLRLYTNSASSMNLESAITSQVDDIIESNPLLHIPQLHARHSAHHASLHVPAALWTDGYDKYNRGEEQPCSRNCSILGQTYSAHAR